MNKERLALVLDASEGKLSKNGLLAIDDYDKFADEVDAVKNIRSR